VPSVLSPPEKATIPKVQMGTAITPRRRRMVNVLDVLEATDSIKLTPKERVAEIDKTQPKTDIEHKDAEATIIKVETEAGPSVPAEMKPTATEQGAEETIPDTMPEGFDYVIRHASGKRLSEEEVFEAQHYARELKYPKGP
jgi:hypothetical protein